LQLFRQTIRIRSTHVKLSIGYALSYQSVQPTPMILNLNVHHARAGDLIRGDNLTTQPWVPLAYYHDGFGNRCTRLVAPAGPIRISGDAVIHDSGHPDPVVPNAQQISVDQLPDDVLVYLLQSRYCDTEKLSNIAWSLFGNTAPGWARVQAVCDFVHGHLTFGYQFARATRTAFEAYEERKGVCRDFAHLTIALCRCLNIPARYCTGYLGDIGVPPVDAPMDFSGWCEVFLGGGWYTFDARHNVPRIGRVLIARGRDAADVAISMTFGPCTLESFQVWTKEVH
jgi:transglutaminase-like putative cysteine protease